MSSLTPPGMGARRRSPLRRAALRLLAVLIALAMLVAAGYAAWWFTLREKPSEAGTRAGCPTGAASPRAKARPKATAKRATTAAAKPTGRATRTSTTARPRATGSARPKPRVAVRALPATKVTINVYNTTSRNGLAATVAADFKKRGFIIRRVQNDPLGRSVRGVAELRHSSAGALAAVTVRAHLPAAAVVLDKRRQPTVDVVLGARYQALRTPAQAAAALRALTPRTTPGC